MMLGQNGNPVREALVVSHSQVFASGEAFGLKLRCAGLPRIKFIAERLAGSAASTFLVTFTGAVSDDVYYSISPSQAVAAAAVGQIVTFELTGVAHDVVGVNLINNNATGPTTWRLQLMATFT